MNEREIIYACKVNDTELRKYGRAHLMFIVENGNIVIDKQCYVTKHPDDDDGKDRLLIFSFIESNYGKDKWWEAPSLEVIMGKIRYPLEHVTRDHVGIKINRHNYTEEEKVELEQDLKACGIAINQK
jgi:hypothetical protein